MKSHDREPESHTLRVLAYIRQSEAQPGEDARTSLSLRSQEDRFRQWCADTGALPLGVIADHDLRGHDPTRPGLRQLLDDAERLKADAVWVLSLSRFARDHILQELTWRDLQARGVKHLISDIESGTDDPFIRGVYGLLHAKSRSEMSAHLKGAFARRARDGGFPNGPTPIGYARPHTITVTRPNGTQHTRETGSPSIDEDGAAFVRHLFERYDTGMSMHALSLETDSQHRGPRGGRWVTGAIRRILTSPIYVGDVAHRGVVVAHNDDWQIVDRDLFDRVQARMTRTPVIRNGVREHWLEGLCRHSCGQRMYYQEREVNGRGTFGCRTVWAKLYRCDDERRMFGGKLLARVVLLCLTRDLTERPDSARALQIAQERAGGRDTALTRKRADRSLTDAQARWRRNHERFSAGKLPPDVMDAEDGLLADAERAVRVGADVAAGCA